MSAMVDPLAFTAQVIEHRGGLVEHEAERLLAVLPGELARALELPETAALALASESDAVIACGLGSALLDRLIALERSRVPVASVRFDLPPPRTSSARSLGERFVLRNAVTEVREVAAVDAVYAAVWASWSAQADDRHDGLVRVIASIDDGSEPAEDWSVLPDPADAQGWLGVSASARAIGDASRVARFVAPRASTAATDAIRPLVATIERRHRRDHHRIAEYYDALTREAGERRRRVDEAALQAKLDHLRAEREAKLHELTERFSLRATLSPVAVLLVEVPCVEVTLRVRRRKREGELVLRLPAGASALDLVTCDGCLGTTARPLVCDDALHRICERCLPSAEGRPRCPACR